MSLATEQIKNKDLIELVNKLKNESKEVQAENQKIKYELSLTKQRHEGS
jgi:hypothetical protein